MDHMHMISVYPVAHYIIKSLHTMYSRALSLSLTTILMVVRPKNKKIVVKRNTSILVSTLVMYDYYLHGSSIQYLVTTPRHHMGNK